jgi:hypothetical protein
LAILHVQNSDYFCINLPFDLLAVIFSLLLSENFTVVPALFHSTTDIRCFLAAAKIELRYAPATFLSMRSAIYFAQIFNESDIDRRPLCLSTWLPKKKIPWG